MVMVEIRPIGFHVCHICIPHGFIATSTTLLPYTILTRPETMGEKVTLWEKAHMETFWYKVHEYFMT
jgi:hypothetical protein